MKQKLIVLVLALCLGTAAQAGYVYTGDAAAGGSGSGFDALDGTWSHDNGSDQWDGSAIGAGQLGGISALSEGSTNFIRIQDAYPRDPGAEPSNRKIFLGHEIEYGLAGTRLEFRARVATGSPLDDLDGTTPWPAGGIGYTVRDKGKGMFNIGEAGAGTIAFSLALASELGQYAGYEGITSDALLVNELNGMSATSDVETGDTGTPSYVPIADATAWNTIVVDIIAGGAGTHQLSISVNGSAPTVLDVTMGDGLEKDDLSGKNYIAMGSSGTSGVTAFDVDYFSVVPEPATIALLGFGGLALLRHKRS